MPATLPNFEYDIFISYRHNDNRSGWVTDFVNALQEELAATIKEPLSIYFDKNPHDGLLETHDVDESLKEKLKCIIFIPIISQTYCDPKSFAWKNEFLAFKKVASEDQFGLKIKLLTGNVASRILPARVHELDERDKTILENEIGPLRPIDFIFKSPGVNRPLLSHEEHPHDNQYKTFYRDQINKVANAVKDIVEGITASPVGTVKPIHQVATVSKRIKKSLIVFAFIALLLAVVGYFLFPRILTPDITSRSIAVLPFVDMSANKGLEYFGDGIAEEIINVLAQAKELKVIARTSSFQFKGKNEDMRKIGEALGVGVVLEGSIREAKNELRITAQLISTSDGVHLWSKNFSRTKEDMFSLMDEIALAVANEMKVSSTPDSPSMKKNEAAYKLYQQGRFFYDRGGVGDMDTANHYFRKSLAIDSTQAIVWHYLSETEDDKSIVDLKARDATNARALALDPNLGDALVFKAQIFYLYDRQFKKAEKALERALRIGTPTSYLFRNAATVYAYLGKPRESLVMGKKAVSLDPLQPHALNQLGIDYFFAKEYDSSVLAFKRIGHISKDYKGYRANLCLSLFGAKKYQEAYNESLLEPDKNSREYLMCYYAYGMGQKERADSLLRALKKGKEQGESSYFIAQLYAFRNEEEETIKSLYEAYDANSLLLIAWVRSEPWFDPFRKNPKFVELMKKIGFDN